jgi:hypothetical protein
LGKLATLKGALNFAAHTAAACEYFYRLLKNPRRYSEQPPETAKEKGRVVCDPALTLRRQQLLLAFFHQTEQSPGI